jgi:hypothetical protein
VSVSLSGGHYFLIVEIGIGITFDDCGSESEYWDGSWSLDLGTTKPDCTTFDNTEVPFASDTSPGGTCGHASGGPVYVTSL